MSKNVLEAGKPAPSNRLSVLQKYGLVGKTGGPAHWEHRAGLGTAGSPCPAQARPALQGNEFHVGESTTH